MKKIFSILVALVIVAGSALAIEVNPKAATGMAVMKMESGFKLFYKGTKVQDVTVSILNEEGRVVFTEKIRNHESFARPYNFNSLPYGEYTIVLASAEGRLLEKVKYNNEPAPSTVGKMKLIALANSPSKYVLTVPNTGANTLNVRIYDATGHIVYELNENISGNYAKLFNLQGIGSDFRIEITDAAGNSQTLTPRI